MDLLIDILLDAGKDTLSLVPFLLVTYLALETLEHVAGDRVNGAIKRAGAAGPVVGSLLGMVPQCGFSAMAATLYAGRVVTLGTLVAVFLSTSDEMLPLLLAEQVPALGILPSRDRRPNPRPSTGSGTVPGGQFDWGGRLLKGNGGARRSARDGRQPSF